MDALTRILSRPVNKPYRTKNLSLDDPPFLNNDGLVDFAPGDVENPRNWSLRRRLVITIVSVFLVVNATFASSSPSGCLPSIAEHFHVSIEATGLTITLFLLGYCAGPLVFAPMSELYGRRWIFYITFLLYFAFNFLCAYAPNFGSLLVGRFLSGTFVSAPLSNAPGLLADLWNPVERANAMGGFGAAMFLGPALGPIIGGFIQLKKDWKWSFYVLIWMGAASTLFMFTIPETHAPTILRTKAKRIRAAKMPGYEDVKAPNEVGDTSVKTVYKIALTRPWKILFDPISFFIAIYLSVVYTLLYMLFIIYPIVFQEKRGWNAGVGELPLVGTIIGAIVGGGFICLDGRRQQKKVDRGEPLEAEDRLPIAIIGGVIFSVSLFWFSWSAEYNSVHWLVPTIAGVFIAISFLLLFVGFLNYLIDTYLMFAASAFAANTIARSACGAAAPLFTSQMFGALGVGGGGSLVGGVAAVLAIIPVMFYKYGKAIRMRSKFAPTGQKKAMREKDEEATPTNFALQGPLESESGEGSTSSSTVALSEHSPAGQEVNGMSTEAQHKKEVEA